MTHLKKWQRKKEMSSERNEFLQQPYAFVFSSYPVIINLFNYFSSFYVYAVIAF